MSLVIPTYNECSGILNTLDICRWYLDGRGLEYELIPVSDGSTDGTVESLRELSSDIIRPVIYTRNRGKGYAVRQGCLAARGRWVVYMDSDLAVPLPYLWAMVDLLEWYDVVIGSRRAERSVIIRPQPAARRAAGWAFGLAVRLLTGLPYSDTQCGFKGFRRAAARAIFRELRTDGFAFDVEVLALARRMGCRVYEMGVEWRDGDRSSISLARGLRAFAELWAIARRDRAVGRGRPIVVDEGQEELASGGPEKIQAPSRPGV